VSAATRVLVAEDDRVARDLLCEILRGEGYEVEAVDDGAGAIARAESGEEKYDLVVSDVRMERSGGLDVLKAFTERAPGTPVILITAFGDVTGAMEAIQRGAYDYVSKPFNIEELRLTVARALERRRLIAEQKTLTSDRARNVTYRVYHTEKDHFVVWSKTSPNWSGYDWQQHWQQWGKNVPWQEDWWQGETRLDLYQTVEDLQPNLPASLYARVRQVMESGSEIEDLDI